MAINPIRPVTIPILPPRIVKPLPLDAGKTINTQVVSTDKLTVGIQNLEQAPHKVVEGMLEKKLYI